MRRAGLLLAAAAASLTIAATAADPSQQLKDPAQEARARSLFRQIRCLVCQNESIDDSEADLADDLRKLVRGQVAAGRTDTQIKDYLKDRYGDFVLLRPAFSLGNAPLWLAPFAVVLGGVVVILVRRRRNEPDTPLTEEEAARLALLADAGATLPPHLEVKDKAKSRGNQR